MYRNHPIDFMNKANTLANKLRAKYLVKKLEAAICEQINPTSVPGRSGINGQVGEERRITFRCAETGKLFCVLFFRQNPKHQFRIVKIFEEETTHLNGQQMSTHLSTNTTDGSFDSADFDWINWYCPHCSFSEMFFQCGTCREYVCGRRTSKRKNGTRSFICYDECGAKGKIEGFIKSYSGSQEQISKATSPLLPRPSSGYKSLPPIRKLLPPSQ